MEVVIVTNVSSIITQRDMLEIFDRYGFVRSVKLISDGVWRVEFGDHRDAIDAIRDLDGRTIEDRRVRVFSPIPWAP